MSDIDDELFALAGGEEDVDVEEGEASSVAASSPESLGSAGMEESDSEAEEDDGPVPTEEVPYPLEGKYKNLKDKAYINSLPQLERERILGERAEESNQAAWNAELIRRAKENESSVANEKKRKADSIEPDDSERKTSRQKVKGRTNDRLEAYKRDREQRGQARQRNDNRRRRRSSSDRSRSGSDLDAEGESEVEYTEYEKAPRHEEPAEVRHFDAVRVSRIQFGDVCFDPGFEDVMTGTYARIGTGQDAQRRTLYKMAVIKGFTTGKPYVFEGKNGKRVATDQYIIAQHGSVRKEYTFNFLSNGRFTQEDLDTYSQSLSQIGGKFPSQSTLKKKYDEIKGFENRVWTDADITEKLKKRNKFADLLKPKSSEDQGPRIPTQTEIEARRLAELNRKNRLAESERVRKALIEERRADIQLRKQREAEARKKREAEEAKKKADEEKAAQKARNAELFGDDSKAGTPETDAPKPKKEKPKGLPTFRKLQMDDDILASMDIGVEIEI